MGREAVIKKLPWRVLSGDKPAGPEGIEDTALLGWQRSCKKQNHQVPFIFHVMGGRIFSLFKMKATSLI